MTFLTSLFKAESQNLHDSAIKTAARLSPDIVSDAQLIQWQDHAKELATAAAHAASEAREAVLAVTSLKENVTRFTAAAEKLAESNPTAANDAADKALGFQNQVDDAQKNADAATAWADETRQSAETAERNVLEGRTKLENMRREQAHAVEVQHQAEARLAERERVAGLTKGLSSMDAALDAMSANAKAAREKADAANLRANVLGKATDSDAAIKAALDEVDHGAKPQTLAEKMAALKK